LSYCVFIILSIFYFKATTTVTVFDNNH